MGLHWQFGVVQNAVSATATAGISLTIVSDGDSDGDCKGLRQELLASASDGTEGETLQIQYTGSGGSAITYTFNRGGSALSVGTLTDLAARNNMNVLAWKGNSSPSHGSATSVTLSGSSGSVHTTVEETGTWYAKVVNATGSNFDATFVQDVDSGTATASATETIVDNS